MAGLKSFVGAFCVATLVSSSAFAAATTVMTPGKPAGIKQAQISNGTLLVGGIAVAVVASVAIVVSSQNVDRSQALNSPAATVTTFAAP